ncbi:glutamate receptor 1-like isoform X6 [Amphiprion ocellaris]|uniref:glutamate receptor 1-like isoform X6 n=1 Tax=Amphiprion ocellaris TaxID=80972 RepID=UPI002410E8DE|nr:glutamate receptor 1-like isoform X6 [Amphiprion ocellaris]
MRLQSFVPVPSVRSVRSVRLPPPLLLLLFGLCSGTSFPTNINIGGLFPTGSHEYEVFRFALAQNQDVPKLVPQVDMVDTSSSFAMTYAFCSQFSKGVYAIMGLYDRRTVNMLMSFCGSLHVCFVTPSFPVLTNNQFVLQLRPQLQEPLMALLEHFYWNHFVYMYSSNSGLSVLQRILDTAAERSWQVTSVNLDTLTEVSFIKLLADLDYKKEFQIIIDCELERLNSIINLIAAQKRNLKNYHYILNNLGFLDLNVTEFQNLGPNVTGFQLMNRSDPLVQKINQEWMEFDSRDLKLVRRRLKYTGALTYDGVIVMATAFNNLRRQRIDISRRGNAGECLANPPAPWGQGIDIQRALQQVRLDGLTGRIQFDERGHRTNYTLTVMELSPAGPRKMGYWNEKQGYVNTAVYKPVLEEFHGLQNRTYVVTTILEAPYMMLKTNHEKLEGNDKYEGYCAELASEIAKHVGFSYRLQLVGDGKYGARDSETKMWNGMVGELVYGSADVAVAPLTITLVREQVIDFTKPFMSLGISIMIKKPTKSKPGVFSFLDPLAYEIWMCIVFAYIGVSVVLFLVSVGSDCGRSLVVLHPHHHLLVYGQPGSLPHRGEDGLPHRECRRPGQADGDRLRDPGRRFHQRVLQALQDRRVREDVVVHAQRRPHGVREEHQRGRGAGPQVEGEVRLPAGVVHERVHRAEEALRHHEGGRKPGLQGLRGGHAQRISTQDKTSALSLSNVAGVFYILIGGLGLAMMVALVEFCYKSRIESRRMKELIDAAMMSTTLGGMAVAGGGVAAGGLGGASGLGGENGRVVAHDFPKAGAQGLPCMSKAAGLGLSSTGM